MDLSGIIFVALAIAWAVYLIPKALKHHEAVSKTRSVESFSDSMRVLAHRGVDDRNDGRSVVTPARGAGSTAVSVKPAQLTPAQRRARREAARRATRRRRNVLATLLGLNVVVAVLAAIGVVSWWAMIAPVALVAAWLVLCRVMVKGERAALAPAAPTPADAAEERVEQSDEHDSLPTTFAVARNEQGFDEVAPSAETSTVLAAETTGVPGLWDPVPTHLPTYVAKAPAARRSVRTIDLDSTGVWTSGHSERDSALAREAEALHAEQQSVAEQPRRAVGS